MTLIWLPRQSAAAGAEDGPDAEAEDEPDDAAADEAPEPADDGADEPPLTVPVPVPDVTDEHAPSSRPPATNAAATRTGLT